MNLHAIVTVTSFALSALVMNLSAQDRILMKDGRLTQGSIENLAAKTVTMQVRVAEGRGTARVNLPADQIEWIEFAPLAGEADLLSNPNDVQRGEKLLELWRQKSITLGWQVSNAGQIGLALADQNLREQEPALLERAMRVYGMVEKQDWNEARRNLAKTGRLRCLIALGKMDDALAEAKVLASQSEDPTVLIEARQVIGRAGFAKLKKFDLDHPRWDQDDELVAQRTSHYHQILDDLLFTPLFYGSMESQAAAALWEVVEFHLYHKEVDQALLHARDLVSLYPTMTQAAKANDLLKATNPAP